METIERSASFAERYPVELREHDSLFRFRFLTEQTKITKQLEGLTVLRLAHIGSTAVEGIWARPILDLFLEIPADTAVAPYLEALSALGYRILDRQPERLILAKGYGPDGFEEEVTHLFLCREGDDEMLLFVRYLNDHLDEAGVYEDLKLDLWDRFPEDPDSYQAGKSDFIRQILPKARHEYEGATL